MGHGIFPNYGLSYSKTIFAHLSKEEKKAVYFPDKKRKPAPGFRKEEEEDIKSKKKSKR